MVLYDKYLIKRDSNPIGFKIKDILNKNNGIITVGKTTKLSLEYDDVLNIKHSGENYHDFKDIDYILFKTLNIPSVEELKQNFVVLEEKGKPNYYYVLKVQI